MLNVLKPHALYVFVKLIGQVEFHTFTRPIEARPGETWSDTVQRYDPATMGAYLDDVSKELLHTFDDTRRQGWKFSGWHIAQL